MPIKYEHGTPSMYASAAQMMGEAERIKTEQVIALREQESIARQKLTERQNQLDIEKEMRAREWELEKMSIVSQNNLAIQERRNQVLADRELAKEIKRQDELEEGLKTINEWDYLSDEGKQDAAFKFIMQKKYGFTVPRIEENIFGQLGIGAEEFASIRQTPDISPAIPEEKGILTKLREAAVTGWPALGGRFGGGITGGDFTPKKAPITPPVVQNLSLTESDKERLNTLDEVSRKEFEGIFNGNNPELIQLALNRLRNL